MVQPLGPVPDSSMLSAGALPVLALM